MLGARETENDDKMLLIVGREAAGKIGNGGETRNNRRNSKYNAGGTNGVTESPSMEID